MSLTFFTKNLLELGTVTAAAAAAFPKERLFDRARALQWQADALAQEDIDVDLGSPMAARAWALVNHNLTVTVQVLKSSDAITYTAVDSANVSGVDPFFRTFTADTARYWRIRLPAGAVEAKAGELLLGVPLTLSRSPKYGGVVDGVVPNVQRDESPGGYAWRVRRGAKRSRLVYTFDTLPDADWALVKQALDETDDGAKSFLVQDIDGVLRWVEWMLPAQGASAVLASLGRHQTTIELLEAL